MVDKFEVTFRVPENPRAVDLNFADASILEGTVKEKVLHGDFSSVVAAVSRSAVVAIGIGGWEKPGLCEELATTTRLKSTLKVGYIGTFSVRMRMR